MNERKEGREGGRKEGRKEVLGARRFILKLVVAVTGRMRAAAALPDDWHLWLRLRHARRRSARGESSRAVPPSSPLSLYLRLPSGWHHCVKVCVRRPAKLEIGKVTINGINPDESALRAWRGEQKTPAAPDDGVAAEADDAEAPAKTHGALAAAEAFAAAFAASPFGAKGGRVVEIHDVVVSNITPAAAERRREGCCDGEEEEATAADGGDGASQQQGAAGGGDDAKEATGTMGLRQRRGAPPSALSKVLQRGRLLRRSAGLAGGDAAVSDRRGGRQGTNSNLLEVRRASSRTDVSLQVSLTVFRPSSRRAKSTAASRRNQTNVPCCWLLAGAAPDPQARRVPRAGGEDARVARPLHFSCS